jgi:hypothetical protein
MPAQVAAKKSDLAKFIFFGKWGNTGATATATPRVPMDHARVAAGPTEGTMQVRV